MKEKIAPNCIFCGSQVNGSHPNERLHIHRWIKTPLRTIKREMVTLDLPTCESCHKKFHPNMKYFSQLPIIAAIIAGVCVQYSFIQKDAFSGYLLGGILGFILCAGAAALFTGGGYLFTFIFFDDTFNASVKVKPYDDLPVVKYIKENGFVDEKDENYTTINTDDVGYTSFLTIRETIKNKFGLK